MVRPEKNRYDVIEKTLDKITKPSRPRTRATYRSYINRYFELLKINDPNKYFDDKRNYVDDVWKVARKIKDWPPKTQITFISCIKRFLIRNKVNISTFEWEDIRKQYESYALINDVIPKPGQLKQLLQLASPKIKTLVMFLATTGCRLDETLHLTWNDIDMENRKVALLPEITKSKKKRFTFFTEETKELLEMWKKERKRHLANAYRKSAYVREQLSKKGYDIKKNENGVWEIYKDGKHIDIETLIEMDQRIFPFASNNAKEMWIALLEKAGKPYNEKDRNPKFKFERYRYHIHSLRKFWFHSFQNTGANKNHIDFMGGHRSLLDATYTDFWNDDKPLKKTYDDFSNCLFIFESKPDLTEVNENLKQKDEKISNLERELQELKAQVIEMRLEKLEKVNGIKK